MKQIGIINTGAGNIRGLQYAVQRCLRPDTDAGDVSASRVLEVPVDCTDTITHLIVPGQGRFGAVMQHLRARQWDDLLRNWINADRPFLGICVGLQILFERSEEDPSTPGLGLLPGVVRRLRSPKQPMMGWADVRFHQRKRNECERTEPEHAAFYFVNSYVVKAPTDVHGSCHYGEEFTAALRRGRVQACQFHPEKSGAAGEQYLAQWLASK